MIRAIKLNELPKNSFSFACYELANIFDSALNANKRYKALFRWENNLKQLALKNYLKAPLTNNIQHFGLRGSVGSGKSTTAIAWFYEMMDAYPGCKILAMRRTYTQLMASLFSQIKEFNIRYGIEADYKTTASSGGPPTITYKNGSKWVFWSSEAAVENTTSDNARGLGSTEYSGALLEEADMIHIEAVDTVSQRLREPSGVPVRVIFYIFNPTKTSHWIYKRFGSKTDVPMEHKDDYQELKFTMEDNKKNLPPGYIESQYAHYANKPALLRRMILGEYGPEIKGKPIFGDIFDRRIHVANDSFIANWVARRHWEDGPLCLSFDFGFRHPAMVVTQDVQIGNFTQIRVLAGYLGDHITIGPFARFLLDTQVHKLFPNAEIKVYGDPAGAQGDLRGVTEESAFDVLRKEGLNPQYREVTEDAGIGLIIDLLEKIEKHPTLGVQPAIIFEPNPVYTQDLIDAMEIGFCQDPSSKDGHLKPLDDDNYIHMVMAMLYGIVNRRSLRRPRSGAKGLERTEYTPLQKTESGLWLAPDITFADLMERGL